MVFFPDKRSRYAGHGQWDVPPGNARGDNPVQNPDPKTDIAARAPLGAFRVSTTEDPALLQSQAEAEALKARQDAEAQRNPLQNSQEHSIYVPDQQASELPVESGTAPSLPASVDDVMGSEG